MISRVLPASRSSSVSPMQTMAIRPAASAASAFALTTASVSRVVGAPLGVADDDVAAAGVLQHPGAGVAGMRALLLHVAVLAADGDGAAARRYRRRPGSA